MAFSYMYFTVCIVLSLCTLGYSRLAPDFINPCNDTSTSCLTRETNNAIPHFVKGMPDLGVPSLDPFYIEKLPLNIVGIKTILHKAVATGFRTCIADRVTYDLSKKLFGINVQCNLTIDGKYTARGNFLTFPIDGSGDFRISLTNLRVRMTINAKHIRDDEGRKHFRVNGYKFNFDYGDRVTFHITNLFKESKELGDAIVSFINENWKLVTQEFGKPIVDTAVDIVVNTIEKFYHKVPCDEILYVEVPDK